MINLIKHAVALNGPFEGKGECLTQGQIHSRFRKNVLRMEQSVLSGKVEIQSDLFFLFGFHTVCFYNCIPISPFLFATSSRLRVHMCMSVCVYVTMCCVYVPKWVKLYMPLYMCIYLYACLCICEYIYFHVQEYTCINLYIYVHVYIFVYIYMCVFVYVGMCMYVHMLTFSTDNTDIYFINTYMYISDIYYSLTIKPFLYKS